VGNPATVGLTAWVYGGTAAISGLPLPQRGSALPRGHRFDVQVMVVPATGGVPPRSRGVLPV